MFKATTAYAQRKLPFGMTSDVLSLMRTQFFDKGYCVSPFPVINPNLAKAIHKIMPGIYAGKFPSSQYPDEWHYRPTMSLPTITRESCNVWKSDRLVAKVVLDESIAQLVSDVVGWRSGARVGQDDLIWKAPLPELENVSGPDFYSGEVASSTVGFHQDSSYISVNFSPYANSSVTCWIALDDSDAQVGAVSYAAGSHKWPVEMEVSDSSIRKLLPRPPQAKFGGAHESESESPSSAPSADASLAFHSTSSHLSPLLAASSSLQPPPPPLQIETPSVPVGHCILHHQDVWHGSGGNLSTTKSRRAIVVHYLSNEVKFRPTLSKACHSPWRDAGYIYGRYRLLKSDDLLEDFFPKVCGQRTEWIDKYLNDEE